MPGSTPTSQAGARVGTRNCSGFDQGHASYRLRNSSNNNGSCPLRQGGSSGGTGGLFGRLHGHSTAHQNMPPLRRPQPVWRPPVSQHTIANHPWARDNLPFARPVAPRPSVQEPQGPVSTASNIGHQAALSRLSLCRNDGSIPNILSPRGTSATIPEVTSVQAAAEMEARDGRPARPVTLVDYNFLHERQDDAGSARPSIAISRASRDIPIVATAPAPIVAPIPTPMAASVPARNSRPGEVTPPEPTFCLCPSWHMPEWLTSCFYGE